MIPLFELSFFLLCLCRGTASELRELEQVYTLAARYLSLYFKTFKVGFQLLNLAQKAFSRQSAGRAPRAQCRRYFRRPRARARSVAYNRKSRAPSNQPPPSPTPLGFLFVFFFHSLSRLFPLYPLADFPRDFLFCARAAGAGIGRTKTKRVGGWHGLYILSDLDLLRGARQNEAFFARPIVLCRWVFRPTDWNSSGRVVGFCVENSGLYVSQSVAN